MFRSQLSGQVFGPRISPVKVVVETRTVEYHNLVDGEDKVSHGTEIVRELTIGPGETLSTEPTLKA